MNLFRKYRLFKEYFFDLATKQSFFPHRYWVDARIRLHALNDNILTRHTSGVSDERLLPDRNVTISLSTFGTRLRVVAPAIESVMEQTVLANRIVLWLSKELESKRDELPASLKMLEKRGLEIRYTEDVGPATKLIPSLKAFPDDVIITIDDDWLYDIDFVDRMLTAHRRFPHAVCSSRIDRIRTIDDGRNLELLYGKADDLYLTSEPLMQPMALGCTGVLYPPGALHEDVFNIDLMKRLSPMADDLWFKCMELLAGTPVYPVFDKNPTNDILLANNMYRIELALCKTNYYGGQDQVQLSALVAHYPQILKYYK